MHLRLRFQNLGKPRTAGLCGREGSLYDHLSLSCAKIERPSPLEKPSCKVRLFAQNRSRKYRQKVTAITLFQTASHHDFQLRSQTAHVCLHGRKRVHTRLSEKNRTQRLTRRNRGLPSLGHSTVLSCQRNSFYSTVLLYTYISRFSVNPQHQQKRIIRQSYHHKFYPQPLFIAFFSLSHKRPTFALTGESGYTLAFAQRIAHKGTHGETGGVLGGGGITTLGAFHTVRKPCVAGYQNGVLCRFWVLPGVRSRRTQRAFGTAMRLCVSLSRGVAAPLGRVILWSLYQSCNFPAIGCI